MCVETSLDLQVSLKSDSMFDWQKFFIFRISLNLPPFQKLILTFGVRLCEVHAIFHLSPLGSLWQTKRYLSLQDPVNSWLFFLFFLSYCDHSAFDSLKDDACYTSYTDFQINGPSWHFCRKGPPQLKLMSWSRNPHKINPRWFLAFGIFGNQMVKLLYVIVLLLVLG